VVKRRSRLGPNEEFRVRPLAGTSRNDEGNGPGGERDDHPSLLTRGSGFESWPGRWFDFTTGDWLRRQSSGVTSRRSQVRVLHRLLEKQRKGYPTGDGTRLERGRADKPWGFDSLPFRSGSDTSGAHQWCPWCRGST
jgi:hypothetical protein